MRASVLSAATVAALVGVYCARVGLDPLTVGAGYVSILTGLYTGPARQVGVSELKRLVPEPYTDSWGMVIAVTLFAVVLVTTFVARRRSGADEGIGDSLAIPSDQTERDANDRSKGDNCVRCGKWVGSSKARAFVCGDCGFGSKKDNCVTCGKWAP